ncbi:hypothetical protein Y590_22805 [Methylobacterium sp. AMS5]|nr:hypothetical protein Y590_22805 [Methylobacterium sp. AMS5]
MLASVAGARLRGLPRPLRSVSFKTEALKGPRRAAFFARWPCGPICRIPQERAAAVAGTVAAPDRSC